MKNLFAPKVEGKLEWFLRKSDEIVSRTFDSSRKRSNLNRYDGIRNNLRKTIFHSSGIECDIYFFGSRVVGTSTWYSDLDFFVDDSNNFHSSVEDSDRAVKTLIAIKRAINISKDWDVKIFLPNTTVPLLRVTYLRTKLECDITASNGLAVSISNMLHHLVSIQPDIILMFNYIRIWNNLNGIKMKRFVLFLLIVFYMQMEKFLPSIKMVQKNLPIRLVGNWKVQFDKDRTLSYYKMKKIKNYKSNVLGFFKFCGSFDFAEYVLCPYSGDYSTRADYETNGFKLDKALCIAGIIDIDRNCGQCVGFKTLENFKKVCANSAVFLAQKGWK